MARRATAPIEGSASPTPARLKFLKSDRAEATAVGEILRRLAVAHPQIRFAGRTGPRSPASTTIE
jgi:DNA mismatch repair protein MutL